MSDGVNDPGTRQSVFVFRTIIHSPTNSPIHSFCFGKATFSPQSASRKAVNNPLMEKTKPFAEKKVMGKIKEEIFGFVRNNV
jgi:hypothetical protein